MNKITVDMVEGTIAAETYFNAEHGHYRAVADGFVDDTLSARDWSQLPYVTFCMLILHNGHKVVGVNTGTVDPANFDADIGRKMARENAVDKVWELLGYELRTKLNQGLTALG